MLIDWRWAFVAASLGAIVGLLWGYFWGIHIGIKETEVRWSEAVGRADDARRNGL